MLHDKENIVLMFPTLVFICTTCFFYGMSHSKQQEIVKGAFWDYQMQVQKERMIEERGKYRL